MPCHFAIENSLKVRRLKYGRITLWLFLANGLIGCEPIKGIVVIRPDLIGYEGALSKDDIDDSENVILVYKFAFLQSFLAVFKSLCLLKAL